MTYEEIKPLEWVHKNDGDFIEGILVQAQGNIGPNNSMLYNIETSKEIVNVWGATILDQKMKLVKLGNQIKITYEGLGQAKSGKKAPKMYKVEVDKEDLPDY